METVQPHKMRFTGDGSTLFGINLVNAVFTICTLGFYWPWARAKKLKYIYGNTEMGGSRFEFHGTGKEMFSGFLKVMVVFAVLFGSLFGGQILLKQGEKGGLLFMLLFYVGLAVVIPFAIHGGARYRLSRTTWRGVHMGYRGNLKEFLALYFKDLLLTIFTFGIYFSWMVVNIRRYVTSHTRVGNAEMNFEGEGTDYFLIVLKGTFLSYLTLGIYLCRYAMHRNHFHINNLGIQQGESYYNFKSTTTGMGFFKTYVPAFLLTILTLGLGRAWAEVMIMEYLMENIELDGNFNPDLLEQTEDNYSNAAGEDAVDVLLDIDLA